MIYTVTFNPSLDYIVSVDDFTCGIVNRTTDEIIFPGGKGIRIDIYAKDSEGNVYDIEMQTTEVF